MGNLVNVIIFDNSLKKKKKKLYNFFKIINFLKKTYL